MRRLLALALLVAALPVTSANAGDPLLATWVVERTDPHATTLTVRGGAGARNHEYAFAAVASATVAKDGRFTGADGGLFFGITPDTDARARTPLYDVACRDIPVAGHVCSSSEAFGGSTFAIWWDDVTFNRVFVVLRGRDKDVDLGSPATPGWRLRRWDGTTRVVTDADVAEAATPAGRGAGTFSYAAAPGGSAGSVAMGKLPCLNAGYTNVGAGAARLVGGTEEKVATCADWAPPAAAAKAGTEWVLDGAATGASDTPARLVIVERPLR